MTANSPSSVAESASSTNDPDAQARSANNGELSAPSQSDVTIDQDAGDGLVTTEDAALPLSRFMTGYLFNHVSMFRLCDLAKQRPSSSTRNCACRGRRL
jgi:hypothetical protein